MISGFLPGAPCLKVLCYGDRTWWMETGQRKRLLEPSSRGRPGIAHAAGGADLISAKTAAGLCGLREHRCTPAVPRAGIAAAGPNVGSLKDKLQCLQQAFVEK